jgi:hypothetical protein
MGDYQSIKQEFEARRIMEDSHFVAILFYLGVRAQIDRGARILTFGIIT